MNSLREPQWWHLFGLILFFLGSVIYAVLSRGVLRDAPPRQQVPGRRWLSKRDIASRLLCGALLWNDTGQVRGGRSLYRDHLTTNLALYNAVQRLLSRLACLEQRDGYLTLAQQQLREDLENEIAGLMPSLEDLGGGD